MVPIKIELPASTPRDLRDEFVSAWRGLGPVQEPTTRSFDLTTVTLILAGISATADLLATAALIIEWREKARQRSVPLDRVTIVAGNQRINLQHTDTHTLAHLLEGLRNE
jgi:hypothetical protein